MTVTGESDEELMGRYARGDAAAFELLYRRHEMRVWRYLERNVGNRATADELMQEVWFAVAREAPRYTPTAKFTTWLFTIAHNRMIDSMRTSRRQTSLNVLGFEAEPVIEQLISEPSAGPFAMAVARDEAGALSCFRRLPAEQREAFLLQIEGDLSVEEIAAITRAASRPPRAACATRVPSCAKCSRSSHERTTPERRRRGRRAVSTRVRPRCGPAERVGAARNTRHAAELAVQRAAPGGPVQSAPDQDALGARRGAELGRVKLDFKQPAANEARWRPAAYGGLAAAALAGC